MLDIHVTKQQQVTLVVVNGRVDSLNAGELGLSLSSAIEDGGTQIVLDLSQVAYMSSAGLRELVSAFKKVRRISGDRRLRLHFRQTLQHLFQPAKRRIGPGLIGRGQMQGGQVRRAHTEAHAQRQFCVRAAAHRHQHALNVFGQWAAHQRNVTRRTRQNIVGGNAQCFQLTRIIEQQQVWLIGGDDA